MGRGRVDEPCSAEIELCGSAAAWIEGRTDRMGRRRKRRTPSWVTLRGALLQPADNPPQPPSSNVDPAGHRHPHETALKGLATIARGWHLRCLPRVPPPQKLPPLPRDPPRRTQQASSRGRGWGWGSNKLPSRETPPTLPPSKTQSGRQPGERLASAKWWKRGQRTRGPNVMRVFNHGEAESPKNAVNRAFASGCRPARVHQPADADCAPEDSRQPGERLASAKWWKRRQHTRGSNATRVFNHGEAESQKNAVKSGVRKRMALGTRSPAS